MKPQKKIKYSLWSIDFIDESATSPMDSAQRKRYMKDIKKVLPVLHRN